MDGRMGRRMGGWINGWVEGGRKEALLALLGGRVDKTMDGIWMNN